jgi:hypothetical protein
MAINTRYTPTIDRSIQFRFMAFGFAVKLPKNSGSSNFRGKMRKVTKEGQRTRRSKKIPFGSLRINTVALQGKNHYLSVKFGKYAGRITEK